jgi:hypothetical protein
MRGSPLVAIVAASIFVAAPAVAAAEDEPPAGCRAAGEFTASLASDSGRAFGEFSSELAQLGLRDDVVLGLHAALCEPPA